MGPSQMAVRSVWKSVARHNLRLEGSRGWRFAPPWVEKSGSCRGARSAPPRLAPDGGRSKKKGARRRRPPPCTDSSRLLPTPPGSSSGYLPSSQSASPPRRKELTKRIGEAAIIAWT